MTPERGSSFVWSVSRRSNRERNRANKIWRRERQRKRRIEAFIHFGEKCADCGLKSSSENYIVFDFHHLKPKNKEIDLSRAHDISNKKFWAEIKKCVMLCSNCHRLRHWTKRVA